MSNHRIDIHKWCAISREWYIFVVNGKTSVMYAREYYLPKSPLINNKNQNIVSPDNHIGSISENQLKMLQALKPDLRVEDIINGITSNS